MTDLRKTYGIDTQTDQDEIIVGDTYIRNIVVTANDIDLSDYVGSFHWSNVEWDSVNLSADNIIDNTINNVSPVMQSTTQGTYTITLTSEKTSSLSVGDLIYGDLRLTNGSNTFTIKRLVCKVKGVITNRD